MCCREDGKQMWIFVSVLVASLVVYVLLILFILLPFTSLLTILIILRVRIVGVGLGEVCGSMARVQTLLAPQERG
jgi:hypothetical protein